MGFGFNLGIVFVVLPLTLILLTAWLVTKKHLYGLLIGLLYIGVGAIILLAFCVEALTAKVQLKKEDYYGTYIIDRQYFKGMQADWQYNTYRFEVKPNDFLYFYITEGQKIKRVIKGSISTSSPYSSARLVLHIDRPGHHILTTNPTTYRQWRSFYMVFNSPVYGNMFFKKGDWGAIAK